MMMLGRVVTVLPLRADAVAAYAIPAPQEGFAVAGDAREDWEHRFGRRSDAAAEARGAADLTAPTDVRADAGAGHVTLTWAAVPDAIGYLVQRTDTEGGEFATVDTGCPDVPEVPAPPFCDTTGPHGRRMWYRVAAVMDRESDPGPASPPVQAAAGGADPDARVDVTVAADRPAGSLQRLWHMIGTERLSQLICDDIVAGHVVADEFADALAIVRDALGVTHVRAHAILHDDLGVYGERDGDVVLDFSRVDAVYDRLLGLGLRPVVELSFMPRDLARDPDATVFAYTAIVSPPTDWQRWADLVRDLTAHLVDRYGIDEVRTWPFEVWNEPNLEVFWSGTQAEYLQLYDTAVAAVRGVDGRLLVGGPATAASGWLATFLDHVVDAHVPLNALTTHTYGNAPLDVRAALHARGLDDVHVWWTEWGVNTKGHDGLADAVYGAPFVLHGMKRAQARVDRLAYWVASDHFEELGRPQSFLHGGFGLLTVGNVGKPRFHALRFAEELGDDLCAVELRGDGAGGLVDAWAARTDDGAVDVLVWNATMDHAAFRGDPVLDRHVSVRIDGLGEAEHDVTVERIDREHANLAAQWPGDDWPTDAEVEALRRASTPVAVDHGRHRGAVALDLHLPMPGVARVRCRPTVAAPG
jgi:xylan 1,4-beta-xylosidase